MTPQQIKDNKPDFCLKQMYSQLISGANELPEYKTVDELHQWIKIKREDRRLMRAKDKGV